MNNLRKIRNEKNLTLQDVATKLNSSPQVISRYERGEREPDQATLKILARFYGVSIDFILGGEKTSIVERNIFDIPDIYLVGKTELIQHQEVSMNGNRLRELRKNRGITQKELAKILNVDLSSIGKWEIHDFTPNKTTLFQLADYFDITLDYLLGRTNESITPELHVPDNLKDVPMALGEIENLTQNDLDEISKFVDYIKSKKKKDQ